MVSKLKLDQSEFLRALNQGHEIEVCFCEKWYFFFANKREKKTTYLFSEIPNHKANRELIFDSELELMKMKIQKYTLDKVLDNLEDYTIY